MIDFKELLEYLKHYFDHKKEIDKRISDLMEKWTKEDEETTKSGESY